MLQLTGELDCANISKLLGKIMAPKLSASLLHPVYILLNGKTN